MFAFRNKQISADMLIDFDYNTWLHTFGKIYDRRKHFEGGPLWMMHLRDCAGTLAANISELPGKQLRCSFLFTDTAGQVWEGAAVRHNDRQRTIVLHLYPRQCVGGEDERRNRFEVRDEVITEFDGRRLIRQWERTVNGNWLKVLDQVVVKISVDEAPTRVGAYVHQLYILADELPKERLRRRLVRALQLITKHFGTDVPLPERMWAASYRIIRQNIRDQSEGALNQIACLIPDAASMKRFMDQVNEID